MYAVAEDSLFILSLVESVKVDRVIEVGVGSGFVLNEYFKSNSPSLAVGTDISPDALKVALTRIGGEAEVEFVLCESCDAFRFDCFELVYFNPPYLMDEEVKDDVVSGGVRGIEKTLDMMESSYKSLSTDGKMVFLVSTLSKWKGVVEKASKMGEEARVLGTKKLFFEELMGIQIMKKGR